MGYTIAQLEELQKHLETLPEIDDTEQEVTKQEAIRRIADTIASTHARGYGMERIAQILTTEGLQISVQTLKSYLTRAKRVTRGRPRSKGATKPAPASAPEGSKPQASSAEHPARPVHEAKNGAIPEASSSTFAPRQDSADL